MSSKDRHLGMNSWRQFFVVKVDIRGLIEAEYQLPTKPCDYL